MFNFNAGNATIEVDLSASSGQTVTVTYQTSDLSAIAGTDYTATSGTVTIPAGQTSATFNVPILGAFEPSNVDFNVTLTSPTNADLGSPTTETVTIIEPTTTVELNTSVQNVDFNAGNATIEVDLSASSGQTITVAYQTSDSSAIAGTDYTATSGTVTIPAGQTSATFNVPILGAFEPSNVDFNVTLTSPTNANLGSPTTETITIIEPTTTVELSTSVQNVNYNAGNATIEVDLSASSGLTVTVAYQTSDSSATAGTDYTATSGTVTIPAGQTSATFNIPILGAFESSNVDFNVSLTSPTNANLGSPGTETVTIIEPTTTVELKTSAQNVNFNAGNATIEVDLSASSGLTVTVAYQTSDSSATAGTDYTATSGTVTIPAGQTSATFEVPILGAFEPSNVDFNVSLTSPTNVNLGNPGTETVTIIALFMDPVDAQWNYDGDSPALQISGTDLYGNALTYSASGLPSGLSIDSGTGLISGTIATNADTSSPYSVAITATDSVNSASCSQTFDWYVSPVTITLEGPGDQTNCYGDTVSLTLPRADSGNHSLTFTATNLPDGLSIDSGTGEISGTISAAEDTYSVTVTATDSDADVSASQTFNWNIVAIMLVNHGDQYSTDGDTVDQPLQTKTSYQTTGGFSFSATGLPPGLSINGSTGEITGTIDSAADTDSPYSVTVTVVDAGADTSAEQTFQWIVAPNTVTVSLANPGTEQSMDGESIALKLMGLDSAGDSLTYSATGLPSGLGVVGDQITGTIASDADVGGPYSVTLTATDTLNGKSATQSFQWNVSAALATVSLTNLGNQTNVDGDSVSLTLVASDSTSDPLTFRATGLPIGLALVGNQIIGTISEGDFSDDPYCVELTATDEEAGVSASKYVTWFCSADGNETTDTPTTTELLRSSANPSASGQSITLTAAVSDENNLRPTGMVTFMDGARILGTEPLDGNGYATLTTSALSIGNHTITARYNGSGTYAASTSDPLTQTVTGGIVTGRVWIDANSDGILGDGEAGFSGATVNLLDVNGTVIASTTTDNSGVYTFNTLLPSTSYIIQVAQPSGYIFTFFQIGNDSTKYSAAGPNGRTASFQVALGATTKLNCGLLNMTGIANNTITGPGAVPGNSTYTYLLTLPGQQFGTTLSIAPCLPASTVAIGATNVIYDAASNTTLESIPVTFANTTPADIVISASSGGQVLASKEIYLVRVSVAFGDYLSYSGNSGPTDVAASRLWAFPNGVALKGVASGVSTGADWAAQVTLTGPGDNLGVDQINVGFIQHIYMQSWSGQYVNGAPGDPTRRVSSLEGKTNLDMAPDGGGLAGPNSTYTGGPWYDRRAGAVFLNATAAVNSKTIQSSDQPAMGVPVVFTQNGWAQITIWANQRFPNDFNSQRHLSQINLLAQFTLDVAATTTDNANGANNSYWAEDQADWAFNGTGTVGAYDANTNNILWTGVGASTNGDASWSALTAPTLENTSGPIFGQAMPTSTFAEAP